MDFSCFIYFFFRRVSMTFPVHSQWFPDYLPSHVPHPQRSRASFKSCFLFPQPHTHAQGDPHTDKHTHLLCKESASSPPIHPHSHRLCPPLPWQGARTAFPVAATSPKPPRGPGTQLPSSSCSGTRTRGPRIPGRSNLLQKAD